MTIDLAAAESLLLLLFALRALLLGITHNTSPPYAFTEHGAIMAANVLNSEPAVEMSVFVVRAFVKLRETIATHKELAMQIAELDRKIGSHDKTIGSIIAAIRQLTAPAAQKPRAIGFRTKRDGEKVPASKAALAACAEEMTGS